MSGIILRTPLWLLNRLGLPAKFTVITLLFFGSALVPTFFMLKSQNTEQAHLVSEQRGVAFLNPLNGLAAHAIQYCLEFQNQQDGASKAADNGPSLLNLQLSVEADLVLLAETAERLDPLLSCRGEAQGLQVAWADALKARDGQRLQAVARFLQQIRTLTDQIVDRSGLYEDSNLATCYTNDLAYLHLPLQGLRSLELSSMAQAAAAGQVLGVVEKARIQMQVGTLQAQLDSVKVKTGSAKAFSNPEVALRLGALLKNHVQVSDAFLTLVHTGLLGERLTVSPVELRYAGRQVVLSCLGFQDAALRTVDYLLAQRLGGSRSEQVRVLGGAVLAAVLAFYFLAALYWGLKDSLGAMKVSLGALREGNLTTQARVESRDEIGSLAQDLNLSMLSLKGLVEHLQDAAQVIQEVSAGYATSSVELARRTEAQAATLEQTAASIEELSASASETGRKASAANRDAQKMKALLAGCQEAVGSAATAMAAINLSAGEVGKVTGVVAEIAFRANLLSVDAVIVAARGNREQGFSMLATEVHGLGQRSASASEAIKDLLEQSAGLVRSGGGHIEQASGTVQRLALELQEVMAFIMEVNSAAGEQALGITQISQAMNQLENLTLHNSALVEQASVSAATLAGKARDLATLMARFVTTS